VTAHHFLAEIEQAALTYRRDGDTGRFVRAVLAALRAWRAAG
jgi:hypothetical protein